ncbi:MAG: hypothetical protein H7Z12_00575 [Rhodospirillaceae bacterium]|nr:hypothetical protein [Rhodospirillales bacterium]
MNEDPEILLVTMVASSLKAMQGLHDMTIHLHAGEFEKAKASAATYDDGLKEAISGLEEFLKARLDAQAR